MIVPGAPVYSGSWGKVMTMLTTDQLMGIKKADMTELKEVKVKLPVRQLLRLHYVKLTSSRTFSDLVSEALQEYFDGEDSERERERERQNS